MESPAIMRLSNDCVPDITGKVRISALTTLPPMLSRLSSSQYSPAFAHVVHVMDNAVKNRRTDFANFISVRFRLS